MTKEVEAGRALKVQIRNLKPENGDGFSYTANRHLQVLVDDRPVLGARSVSINLEAGKIPLVTLTFAASSLEMDPSLLLNAAAPHLPEPFPTPE